MIKQFFKLTKDRERNYVKVNLLFIFVFLNIWDFAVNRSFFNGMILGVFIFGPATFLWFVNTVRATAFITLISVLEFVTIAIFLAEGFELGGISVTPKTIFWLPYLVAAGVNGFWGLKIYSNYREKKLGSGSSI
ncbi:hypothetical protein A3A60_01220 [Candidatus Curtissbacteria bacterium RIFCSPLOWO2_01_FULL_42_26]|uniref:Uncharacterized protein n=1 Tax=Candidatus Curtissbacteria bacterium RIFCSPLOWO2_01_FULL_42_26 TaxID=1797729 RepID=A0A1F5HYH8_9BACT|nr:MAG: hypothetical protein A3A60_01220 [Candidatus Curtissbacteria bacterium RIFCSPLOWO2_01_FULL_42_26]